MKAHSKLHIAAAVFLSLLALPLIGQDQHPNLERGFSVDKVYDFAEVDNVGFFDGSLKVAIPIGPVYHVNGGLSYDLKLFYNNQIWDLFPGILTIWPEGKDPVFIPYVDAYPSHRSNAGAGWFLSLGKIFDSGTTYNSLSEWIYESQDGHDHKIGDLDDVGDVAYSNDGSFIRAKRTSTTEVTLELPDGTTHTFDRYSTNDWRLRSIQDRFGNRMWIEYSASGDIWTIKDDHGRQQTVYFISKNYYNAYGNRLVDRVVVAGFNGTTREYKFNYDDADFHTSCDYRDGGSSPTSFNRSFLTSINLPDGSKWEMKYSNSIGTPSVNCDQGALTSLKMPTHGTIKWSYINYELPTTQCNGGFWAMANIVPGVGTRTLLDETLADGGRNTTYTPWRPAPSNTGCTSSSSQPEYATTTVRTPDGGRTVHYFSIWDGTSPSPNGHVAYERGLPYRRLPDGRKLSTEFLGNCSGTNCPALRSTYVNWEFERTNVPLDTRRNHNPRLQYTKTVFNDDGDRYTQKFSTRYDGVGHYRTTLTSSNIGGADRFETTNYDAATGDMIVDAKGFIQTDVTRPTPSQPWILTTYSSRSSTQGNTSIFSTYCFERSTGFLLRERQWANADGSGSSHDLLKVYAHTLPNGDAAQNGKGNVLREEYYGGDDQNLSIGSLDCDSVPSTAPQYTILHEYAFGTRKSTKYKDALYKTLDLTIDLNTGLPKEDRDTAGALTRYDYDSLERVKEAAQAGRATTQYVYDTPASPSQLTVKAVDPVSSAVLTDARNYYDAFGRIIQTREKMPAGWSTINVTYDSKGRKQTVSTPEYRTDSAYEGPSAFAPAHVTAYAYDPFDRVVDEARPDNTETTYAYTGDREKATTRYLATDFGQSDSTVTTTEDYDFEKRLINVVEKSGPPSAGSPVGTDVTTSYVYDVANHLIAVRMSAPDGVVQNRIFDYDGRGLVRWESHPESGMTSYTYDARGNIRTKRIGAANTYFDLNHLYDGNERLTRVEGRDPQNPTQFRVLKEFEYGDANAGTDLRQGKLVRASRYNYRPEGYASSYPWSIVRVTETFAYADAAGQKTDRTTIIATSYDGTNWQEARGISQSVSYDILGLPSLAKYPMCVNCGTPPGNPWREITSSYANGRLTGLTEPPSPGNPPSIPSFISNIAYAASGMRSAIYHTNTIVDTRTPDPSGIPRPSVLKSETYKPCSAPLITSQPLGVIRTTGQGSVRLQVAATGSQPLSYAWYDNTVYPATLVATGTTFIDVAPTSTRTYYVEVTNDCRTLRSNTITVKYGDCVDAWVGSATATRNTNGTYTLSVTAFGSGTLNYMWQRKPDDTPMGTTAVVTTGVLTSFDQYLVTVTNGCGPGDSRMVYVSVPISVAPMTIDAHKNGTNQITVSWSTVTGASSYELQRRDGTSGWTSIANGNFTQYNDQNLPLDTAYAYRVTANSSYNEVVGQSPADIASTFTFTAVAAGSGVTAGPLNELLRAVNGVRALSGWSDVAWSNILSPSDSLPDPNAWIIARHVLALRARLNEAMQSVGAPANGYTDSDVQGLSIRAVHITELQDRMR